MQISMYQASVPRLANLLENLSSILDKTQAHVDAGKIDLTALMDCRLAPDMYPFSKQVQIVCDKARSVVARLARMEVPYYVDDEKTLAELKVRIARSVRAPTNRPFDRHPAEPQVGRHCLASRLTDSPSALACRGSGRGVVCALAFRSAVGIPSHFALAGADFCLAVHRVKIAPEID